MDTLQKLFGSAARVKLLRLFLMNPEGIFDAEDVAKRSKIGKAPLRKELRMFLEIGFIKERRYLKLLPQKDGKFIKKNRTGYGLHPKFPYITPLKALVTEISVGRDDVASRFKGAGNIKIIVIAGVFLDEPDSRVDILIVGDKLNKASIQNSLRHIEAELGKELTYSVMDTPEFEYRYGIYDKFVRDILDYPHMVVVNKLNLF
jgi:hypothetical protein